MMCDFSAGFRVPEMAKRRPVVIVSPKIAARPKICTIVALSTLTPEKVMPYHCQIDIRPKLPSPWESEGVWVKGDMINAVGFHRLDFIRMGKDNNGKRIYLYEPVSNEDKKKIRQCMLHSIGLSLLTKHL